MAERGGALQSLLIDDADEEMSAVELIDPVAMERRLVEARARRAESLRRRAAAAADAPASGSTLVFPTPRVDAPAPAAPIVAPAPHPRAPKAMALGLFAGGLAAGLAVAWFGVSLLRDPGGPPTAAVAPAAAPAPAAEAVALAEVPVADPTAAMAALAPLAAAASMEAPATPEAASAAPDDLWAPPAPSITVGWSDGAPAPGEAMLIRVAQFGGPTSPAAPASPRIGLPAGAAPEAGLAPLAAPAALTPPPVLAGPDRDAATAVAARSAGGSVASIGVVLPPLADGPGARPSAAAPGLARLGVLAAPASPGFDPLAVLPEISAPAASAPVPAQPAIAAAPAASLPAEPESPAPDPLPAVAAPAPRAIGVPNETSQESDFAALSPAPEAAPVESAASRPPADGGALLDARVLIHFPFGSASAAEAAVSVLEDSGAEFGKRGSGRLCDQQHQHPLLSRRGLHGGSAGR